MNRTGKRLAAVLVMVPLVLAAMAGGMAFRESVYRADSIALTATVAVAFTNGTERAAIGSVFVRADQATNTWTIQLIQNGYTNILKSGTLTPTSNTLVYEGTGGVPWGNGGIIRITGTMTDATTNIVQTSIHTLLP